MKLKNRWSVLELEEVRDEREERKNYKSEGLGSAEVCRVVYESRKKKGSE